MTHWELVGHVASLIQKMRVAAEEEDCLGAQAYKLEVSSTKEKLREASVCSVCWMPVPSQYAMKRVPEKWYFDQLNIRCAYCGKDCIVPASDSHVEDHQALIVRSLKYRVRSELLLSKELWEANTLSRKAAKAFDKRLPRKVSKGQRGKGARLRKDVDAAVMVGCLHRTMQRCRYEPELNEFEDILADGLRYLGGL